jgi:PAS domain S-box-containing protein
LASNSDKGNGFSLLAGFGNSSRILIIGLALLIVLIGLARGYLFLQYRNAVTSVVTNLELSTLRNSYVLTAYQLTIDSYALAERVVAHRADKSILKPLYIQKTDSVKTLKSMYGKLSERIPEKREAFDASVDQFFHRIDTLLAKTDRIFDSRESFAGNRGSVANHTRLVSLEIANYFPLLIEDWKTLSHLEYAMSGKEFSRQKRLIELMTERWFLVTSVLIVIAIVLTVVLIMLAGRTTSLARRLSAVLEHNISPIEVISPSGVVLYVNSEFERWSGLKKVDVVGMKCFRGFRLLDAGQEHQSIWDMVQSSIRQGATWTGDVEMESRPGMTSSLIVFPVFTRQGKLRQLIGLHHDSSEKKRLARAVEETREQYHMLIDSSRDAIVVVQAEKLVFVNPAALRIFQYESEEEMSGLDFKDVVAPASRPLMEIASIQRSASEDNLKNYEMKGLSKNGTLIDLELNARLIVWNGTQALHASFRDISERKALERQQAIWMWEQETLSSIDRQLLGIVDLQKVLDIILQQVVLLTRCQFVGIAMVDLQSHQGHWRAARGNRLSIVGEQIRLTADSVGVLSSRDHLVLEDFRSQQNSQAWDITALHSEDIVSAGFFPLVVNGESRGRLIVGFRQMHRFPEREVRVLISMAEKVSIALASGELYEDLLMREKELEILSGARVQAQEEERRRISREIHDGLGQLLTAIKFNLEILEDGIPAEAEASTRIAEVKQLLDNVMKEAREISANLMPSVLDDFGLPPGLQSLCEQFAKGTGLKVAFHEHGLKERLKPDVEIGIYRIVQEALTNIAKHAHAKEVEVQIVSDSKRLRLMIEDDGKGMDVMSPSRKPAGVGGTGLVSMRERAASFSGTFMIDSSPGNGTLINVEIPLITD